jgi:hypothetical protein
MVMKVKKIIIDAIDNMDDRQLNLLYMQIRAIELIKPVRQHRQAVSIDHIREMTSSSKSSWADTVTEDREDRI